MPVVHRDALGDGLLLDVREVFELAAESVPGATHIPLGQLRSRLGELPRDREICVICRSGGRPTMRPACCYKTGITQER